MTLDRQTLEHHMAVLLENGKTMDKTISDCTEQLKQLQQQTQTLAVELERLKGAREYHALVVKQVQLSIQQVDNATTSSSPTPQ